MSEFTIEPVQTENVSAGQQESQLNGQSIKNLKELKVGNGAFYVDSSGNIETRDENGVLRRKLYSTGKIEIAGSDGIVTILIDPEG